jgi:peroxiredoxin
MARRWCAHFLYGDDRRELAMSTDDPTALPPDLPVPVDDGAADHLLDMRLPRIALPSTHGTDLSLDQVGPRERTIVYAYPRTRRPGEPQLTEDWDLIPGARGCTPEACGFRALRLPTLRVADHVLLKRLTLVVRHARIEHVFYPVFPPDLHAAEVLTWLENHPLEIPG